MDNFIIDPLEIAQEEIRIVSIYGAVRHKWKHLLSIKNMDRTWPV